MVHIVAFVLLLSVVTEIIENTFLILDCDLEISFEGEEEEIEEELEEFNSKVISLRSDMPSVKISKEKLLIEINENLMQKDYLSSEIPISVPPPQIFKLS